MSINLKDYGVFSQEPLLEFLEEQIDPKWYTRPHDFVDNQLYFAVNTFFNTTPSFYFIRCLRSKYKAFQGIFSFVYISNTTHAGRTHETYSGLHIINTYFLFSISKELETIIHVCYSECPIPPLISEEVFQKRISIKNVSA